MAGQGGTRDVRLGDGALGERPAGAGTGFEQHGYPTTGVTKEPVLDFEDIGSCGMLGGEGRQGNESVMGGEGESHASSTMGLRQIVLPSQIVSQLETDDKETVTGTAAEVPPPPVINTAHGCTVSDEASRGGILKTKVVSRAAYVVEKIYAMKTTTTALVPGQDRSGRAEIEVRGIATDKRITEEPGHTEEAATRAEPVLQENVIVLNESEALLGILIVLESVVIQRFSDPPTTLDAVAFTTCNVALLCLVPADRRMCLMMATAGLTFQAWKLGVLPLAAIIATGIRKVGGAMKPNFGAPTRSRGQCHHPPA
ncbi:hypothetical protein IEO21_07519 [Rhodonia placenta]|uniref:Uncharacterized protein n=1 Tax=Rhodonia placenta TaxID=104341 RepID=A0A8H7TZL4_9APHY|nr:hypothetical protein IEO21_07519 [Postia placenta]